MTDNINILSNSIINKVNNQHIFNFDLNKTIFGKNILFLIPNILKIITFKN